MERENVNCGNCFQCQKCFEAQGACPQCYDCQNCVTAQGGQDLRQQRPDGRSKRMGCPPMQGCPQMRTQQMCPQMQGQGQHQPCHMQRGGGQQGLTEAKVKEIVLDVLIAAGVIGDKERKGIEIE